MSLSSMSVVAFPAHGDSATNCFYGLVCLGCQSSTNGAFLEELHEFDSFTIHFLSFHPLGCSELLEVLPVVEVEELVNGAKLVSAAGSEHMLMSKADVELMSITDDVCASCY